MEGTFCLFRWHAVCIWMHISCVCAHTWFPLAFLSPAVISLWAGPFYASQPGLWALFYFPIQAVVLPHTVCSNQKCESEWRQEAAVVASRWLSCALGKEGRVRPILAGLADGNWSLRAPACAHLLCFLLVMSSLMVTPDLPGWGLKVNSKHNLFALWLFQTLILLSASAQLISWKICFYVLSVFPQITFEL